jgi:hypothetical protein
VLDAIGSCRDPQGRTPPAAVAMLNEILDDSTNAANPCDDGYLHGAVIRLLAEATPGNALSDAKQARGVAGATPGAPSTDARQGRAADLLAASLPGAPSTDARQERPASGVGSAGAAGGAGISAMGGDSAAGAPATGVEDSWSRAIDVHIAATVSHIRRMLRLDALRPTHGRVLTACCLRALMKLEIKWGLVPSWQLYLRYETDEGAPPEVRLEAARCLLALAMEMPTEGVATGIASGGVATVGAATAGVAMAGAAMGNATAIGGAPANGGGESDIRLAGAPHPCGPVLALALRLDEARWHAPLERLQLWRSFLEILEVSEASEAKIRARAAAAEDVGDDSGLNGSAAASGALARQRVLLGSGAEGGRDGVGAACCQLLWHMMTSGGHPAPRGASHAPADVRLRLVLCRVWRIFFGEGEPDCLGISEPQRISHREILPGYNPPYRARQKAERAAKLARQAEEKAAAKSALRLRFANTVTGVTTHARHGISDKVTRKGPQFYAISGSSRNRHGGRPPPNAGVSVGSLCPFWCPLTSVREFDYAQRQCDCKGLRPKPIEPGWHDMYGLHHDERAPPPTCIISQPPSVSF